MKEVQLLAAFHKNEPLSAYWCFETGKRKTIGIQKQTENNCLLSHREFQVTLNIKLFLNLVLKRKLSSKEAKIKCQKHTDFYFFFNNLQGYLELFFFFRAVVSLK